MQGGEWGAARECGRRRPPAACCCKAPWPDASSHPPCASLQAGWWRRRAGPASPSPSSPRTCLRQRRLPPPPPPGAGRRCRCRTRSRRAGRRRCERHWRACRSLRCRCPAPRRRPTSDSRRWCFTGALEERGCVTHRLRLLWRPPAHPPVPLPAPRCCSGAGPRPTVITPHGGPHTAYTAQYFMPLTYLVALGCAVSREGHPACRRRWSAAAAARRPGGALCRLLAECSSSPLLSPLPSPPPRYNVVLLNYRGSTGYGEASIQSLPGSIGTNDVADCLAGLQAAVDAGGLWWVPCRGCAEHRLWIVPPCVPAVFHCCCAVLLLLSLCAASPHHHCRPGRPVSRGRRGRLARRLPYGAPGGAAAGSLQGSGAAQPGLRPEPDDPR